MLEIDPELVSTVQRYSSYSTEPLSYGTVRDYCDSFDHLNVLATRQGDLKDLQRPWTLKAILGRVARPGRVLEIGAGQPFVADLLSRMGYEVCIVDPYDGSGNGPFEYEQFRRQYPRVQFVRSEFHDNLSSIPAGAFDCIYSISVLEHVPPPAMKVAFRAMIRALKPSGVSIHAVDHVHRGAGAEAFLDHLKRMAFGFGFSGESIDQLLARLSEDTDTYYLSAESHNRWRGTIPYDEFPMRVVPGIQFVSAAAQLTSDIRD